MLTFFYKDTAVKIGTNEELGKSVITPIKLSGISGQCHMLFSHFLLMPFTHLFSVCTSKSTPQQNPGPVPRITYSAEDNIKSGLKSHTFPQHTQEQTRTSF